MSRKITYIVVGILVVFLVLSFAKDTIVKISVEEGVNLVTGLRLSIRSFKVGILRSFVDIKGLKLRNPKGFKDKMMMDMPHIYVDYDLPAILGGKIHLNDMVIDLKELLVVKNEQGDLNLNSLNVVKEPKEAAPAEKKEMPQVQIDNLRLKVGKVIYKDYSKGGAPSVQEFDINIDESYKNIDDPQELVSLIIVKAMMKTTIARLTNFNVEKLEGYASDVLVTAEKIGTQAAATAGETVRKTGKAAQKTVKEGTQVLKDTTKGLADAFMSPFKKEQED